MQDKQKPCMYHVTWKGLSGDKRCILPAKWEIARYLMRLFIQKKVYLDRRMNYGQWWWCLNKARHFSAHYVHRQPPILHDLYSSCLCHPLHQFYGSVAWCPSSSYSSPQGWRITSDQVSAVSSWMSILLSGELSLLLADTGPWSSRHTELPSEHDWRLWWSCSNLDIWHP